MKLIVGLGNPGREYEMTRHNLGFMLIDRLMSRAGGKRLRDEGEAKVAETTLAGQRVLLVKPQTYMNQSGDAVAPLLRKYGEGDHAALIVAFDDVALPLGMIRIRPGGSAGGQKGMKSLIERLGGNQFPRIRMGIRPDHPVEDLASYVLSNIPKRSRRTVDEVIERAADAVDVVLADGVETAMRRFNERLKNEPDGSI